MEKVFAEIPFLISSRRFLFVAAMIRTSTSTSLSLPTRQILFACRARSTLAWAAERHVADLVHEERTARGLFELALALFDGRGEGARSWPKSSLSISSEGIAAQLTSTKGARPGCSGVEPAGDELLAGPVLAGDQNAASHGATLSIRRRTCCICSRCL